MRAVPLSLALALLFAAPPVFAADMVVLAFTDRDAKSFAPDEGAWVPNRLADLVEERLIGLGFGVRDRRFFDPAAPKSDVTAVISGRVKPEVVLDATTPLVIEVDVKPSAGKPAKKRLEGKANDLEKIAADIALLAIDTIAFKVDANARALIAEPSYPFAVHRFLGLARVHLDADSFRKSMVMYDRAQELMKTGAVPEAIDGRQRAEAEMVGRGESTFGARADLAPSAAERAEVALKHGEDAEAVRALEAYLRYTPERAQRWTLELPLVKGAPLVAKGAKWIVQSGEGAKSRFSVDPRTGTILAREPALRGLIGMAGTHALILDGKTLSRVDEGGRPKWKVDLPFKPHGVLADAVELTSGLAGIMGEREVIWVEVSFGALGQQASGVRPLAAGSGGVIVVMRPNAEPDADGNRELALLRPGKKAPTWTTKIAEPLDAAMTADRILVITRGGLVLLRAHDGKEAARTLPLTPEARFIGVDGRYAVVMLDATDRAALIDVLSGEQTAIVRGPGRAIGSYTAANGVAIFYSTGDLIFFDRDGAMLDRALVPGEPIDLVRGSPMTPGPVAITTRGLFAYAEVPIEENRRRDVDAMLELARVLDHQKESAAGLRLAQVVAMSSAGRIDRAEELRAELYAKRKDPASQAAARWAKLRAEAAKDPAKALPAFRLIGD